MMLSLGSSLSAFGGISVHAVRMLAPCASLVLRSVAGRLSTSCHAPAEAQRAFEQPNEQLPGLDSQPFNLLEVNVNLLSCHYPETVFDKVASLVPLHPKHQRVAIDFAMHGVSRTGIELAKRGYNVLSVAADAQSANATVMCAAANTAALDLVPAQFEPSVVRDNAAHLVTVMNGLDLLNMRQALLESHRILKPGGRLVVAFTDRDLASDFVDELEEVTECHVPSYQRSAAQHCPAAWAGMLRQEGLFKLVEYSSVANPLVLRDSFALGGLLGSQDFAQRALSGQDREQFEDDLRALAEYRFGDGEVVLPLSTRLFILEKVAPPSLQ